MLTFHFSLPSKAVSTEGDNRLATNRGEIYIETENGYFPCIGWSDRFLSVITMWIGNTVKMLDPNYGGQNIINYFMNGPYSFAARKTGKNHIEIKFMRRVGEAEKEEIPLLNITFIDYCNALLALTENVLSDPSFPNFGKEQERINLEESVAILITQLQ